MLLAWVGASAFTLFTSETHTAREKRAAGRDRELPVWGRYAKKGTYVAKSSEQDKAEGALYKVGGRVLQAIGSLSGDRKKKIKGRLGRGKGAVKDREGRLKDLFK